MTHSDLIAKLEALDGPDRDVDYRIEQMLVRPEEFPESSMWPPFMIGSKFEKSIPAYTASLDAAIALVERALPGREWSCGSGCKGISEPWGKVRIAPLHSVQENGPTPAIALLIATLKALEARDG